MANDNSINIPVINNDDLANALKYIAFAGLAGGSLSALTGAVRLLRNENFRNARPSDKDDDVMYVVKKAADELSTGDRLNPDSGSSMASVILATAGMPFAAAGGFMLGNWLLDKYMRDKAQKELDEAQKLFVNAQGYNVLQKESSMCKSAWDWTPQFTPDDNKYSLGSRAKSNVLGGVHAIAALATAWAVASAIATNQYLKRNYPYDKPEKPKAPKKIVYVDSADDIAEHVPVVDTTEEKAKAEYTPTEKEAAFREDNCMELATRFLCDMDKQASIASGIVHTVAAGRLREFEKAVKDIGFEQALNITKGASARPVNRDARELATIYCTKLASFAPQFKLVVAADFHALHPHMMKEAASMSPAMAELALDQAAHLECATRYIYAEEKGARLDLEKAASVNVPMDIDVKGTIELWIEKLAANPVVPDVKDDSSELSDGGANPNSAKPDSENAEDTAEFDQSMVEQGEGSDAADAVDQTLSSGDSILSLIGKNPGRTNRAFSS